MNKWYILLSAIFLYSCEPKPHRLSKADLKFPDPELEGITKRHVKVIVGIDTSIARKLQVSTDKAFDSGFAYNLHYYVGYYAEYHADGKLKLRTNYLDCPNCFGWKYDEIAITYDINGHIIAEKGDNTRNNTKWTYSLKTYGSSYQLDKIMTMEQGTRCWPYEPVKSYFFNNSGRLIMDSANYGGNTSTHYRYGADGRLISKHSVNHRQYDKKYDLMIPKVHNTRYYYTNGILDSTITDHIYSNGVYYSDRYYYDKEGIITSSSVSAPNELDESGKMSRAPFTYNIIYRYQTY